MKWMRLIRRNFKSWKQNLVKAATSRFRSSESIFCDFCPSVLLFKKHEWLNCALKQVLNCFVQRCILEVLLHKAIFFNSSCNFTAAGLLSLVPRVRGRKNGIESLQRVHLK